MQGGHDDFEGGFVFEFRVRVDGDAAPIVAHTNSVVTHDLDLDETRMSGDRLIHRIIDHFGEQMVHSAHVSAANIHAGATAHRLQPFQHFNIAGGIAFLPFDFDGFLGEGLETALGAVLADPFFGVARLTVLPAAPGSAPSNKSPVLVAVFRRGIMHSRLN